MTPSLVLSTEAVAARDRAPQWREWIGRHFGGLESDMYGDVEFDGHLCASRAGDVILTKLEAGRHRVLRTPQMARHSDSGYLKIVAPWHGSAQVEQQGRQAGVRSGGWAIYDTTASYAVDNPERSEHLIVMLPKDQMAERSLRLDRLMARQVGGASGISRVALETMRNTYQELPAMSEAAARGAGEMIMQLVRLSLLELADKQTDMTQREALLDRIRDHVARHLRDPELSIEQIARTLNCSKRHLHNAFTRGDETLSGYIQQQRLQACIQELRQGSRGARAITDVALSWGFSNLSHFSRTFREHTGMSPSEFRNSQRPAGSADRV